MDTVALHLYWLMIGLVAVPLSPFNRVAAVIVAARVVNQVGYWALPEHEAWIQTAVFAAAAFAALIRSETFENMITAVIFIPAGTASLYWASGALDLASAWWIVIGCGFLQLILLPACTDWQRVATTYTAYRRRRAIDQALRWLPC